MTRPLADTTEIARLLGVTPATVRSLAARGRIPALRFCEDGPWRFDIGEVLEAARRVARAPVQVDDTEEP